MTVNEAFSKNLSAALKEKHWTQVKLSARSGLDKRTINNLITCKNAPTLMTAWLIAKALEVSLDDLVKGADE